MSDKRQISRLFRSPIALVVALLLLGGSPGKAQICGKEECRTPEVHLPLFCANGVEGELFFGLDVNFDIVLEARFLGAAPAPRFDLFMVNGLMSTAKADEVKVGRLPCRRSGEGTACRFVILPDHLEELQAKFDFEQTVITASLRRKAKDVCLTKFTNNPETISLNDRTQRAICSFEPNLGNPAVSGFDLSGDGYFDPRGYGVDGEAHFHLTMSGFPEGRTFRGCVQADDSKYQRVLAFRSYGPGSSDSSIYGKIDSDEGVKLTFEPLAYSYDLLRQVNTLDSPFRLAIAGRNLSQINRQVSAPSASRERTAANKTRRRERRREKRKKRGRKRAKVVRRADLDRPPIGAARRSNEEMFAWLSFDPLRNETLYISNSCKGNVPAHSYGVVRCGTTISSPEASCVDFASVDPEAASAGRVCSELREQYALAVVRVKQLPAGSYTVCLDETAVDAPLVVSGQPGEEFGSLEITGSALLASRIPNLALFSGSLETVKEIAVAKNADCSDQVLTATVKDSSGS